MSDLRVYFSKQDRIDELESELLKVKAELTKCRKRATKYKSDNKILKKVKNPTKQSGAGTTQHR